MRSAYEHRDNHDHVRCRAGARWSLLLKRTAATIGVLALMVLATVQPASASSRPTHAQYVAYTNCMRRHGVKDFPEATPIPPHGYGYVITRQVGTNPHFTSATKACQRLMPH